MIVAGVDGSDGGRRALAWAVREATARGGTVWAVTAWRWDLPGGGLDPSHRSVGDLGVNGRAGNPEVPDIAGGGGDHGGGDAGRVAAELLASEVAALPVDAPVVSRVREGRAADVLGAVARDADLLVLGSHGHSRVWHTVLGSVAEECIRKATCPVVVIPVPREPDQPAGQ